MKKITSIKLHNFRAFYGNNYQLTMPQGENVLIYGENGSGKSSIYNALKDFFESSDKPNLQFWRNIYADATGDGAVAVSFSEFPQTNPATPDDVFDFNNVIAHRTAQTSNYIRRANKARAFLSYQELVRSYLAEKNNVGNPNLYELVIETLLANHILIGSESIGKTVAVRWAEIKKGLDINSARFKDFKKAKNELVGFEQDLIAILTPILINLNYYLDTYFNNNLVVDVEELTVRTYKFATGKGWYVNKNFRLKVNLFNETVNNGYHNLLNEARLSAVAICLYLAAIKKSPQPDLYKIIFLDDVFIGLDTSNRIPLLELIKTEFPEHQVFISTYDRFWYETAVRWFNVHNKDKWKYYEIFIHQAEHLPTKIFDKPIVTIHKSNFAKAQDALKNRVKPDYPSAANNFRKYAEELLTDKYLIPEHENRNQLTPLADFYGELTLAYKLTQIVDNAIHFLNSIHQDASLLIDLKSHLSTLLHPLSHFELSAPVYKGELERIENCLVRLAPFLVSIKVNYKPVAAPLKKIRINFIVSPNVTRRYLIVAVPQLYIVNDGAGNLQFSICDCYTPNVATETVGAVTVNQKCDHKQNPTMFRFNSLANACETLRNADIVTPAYVSIPIIADYIDNIEFEETPNNFVPLRNLLVW